MSAYEFTTDWFTNNVQAWYDLVLPSLSESPRRILEMGTYEGRSACWLLDNAIRSGIDELVCIDHWPESLAAVERRFDKNNAGRATKIKGNARKILLELVQQKTQNQFDVIYVDADHDARDTLYLSVLAWELLKPGGIMVFDDYLWEVSNKFTGVMATRVGIDAFLATYELELSVLHKQYQVFVQKRKNAVKDYHWAK